MCKKFTCKYDPHVYIQFQFCVISMLKAIFKFQVTGKKQQLLLGMSSLRFEFQNVEKRYVFLIKCLPYSHFPGAV